jgi:hypothetical protein
MSGSDNKTSVLNANLDHLYSFIHSMDTAKNRYWEIQTDFVETTEASIGDAEHKQAFNDACVELLDEITTSKYNDDMSLLKILHERLAIAYGKALRINMLKNNIL